MKKSSIVVLLSSIFIISTIVYILVPKTSDIAAPIDEPDNIAENITAEIFSDIEKYILGSDAILQKIKQSKEYKQRFQLLVNSEPAFTGNFADASFKSDVLTEIILTFSESFQTPEIYADLVKLVQGNSSSAARKMQARKILANGGDAALQAIYEAFYDKNSGIIKDSDGLKLLLQEFKHYWQLKFWGNHFFVADDSEQITGKAKNEFGNTTVTNSPASIKVLIRLLKDFETNDQKILVLMNLSKTRIPPQWNSWFIPMFADVVSSFNTVKIDEIWPYIKEILTTTRRAGIINQFNTWLKKNPRDTFGFKILRVAVKQAQVELKRWNVDSINSDEPTNLADAPNPDAEIKNQLNPLKSAINLEDFSKLTKLYKKYGLFADFSALKDLYDLYDVEKYSQLRKFLFAKPILLEIAEKAGLSLSSDSWQGLLFLNMQLGKSKNSEYSAKFNENQKNWFEYFKIHNAITGIATNSATEKADILIKTDVTDPQNDSLINKMLYEIKLENLSTIANQADFKTILTESSKHAFTDNKLTEFLQVVGLKYDEFSQENDAFNPFFFLLSESVITNYEQVLSALNFPRHKFGPNLLKRLMAEHKTDLSLMLKVFQVLKNFPAQDFETQIADFLESEHPELQADAILMLPAKEKYFALFTDFLKSPDAAVKTSAAIRLLEDSDSQRILSAITLLRALNINTLSKNLYRIKNVDFLVEQVLILEKIQPDLLCEILVKRPEILNNEVIYDKSFETFKNLTDATKQIRIMSALFTKIDKITDVLAETAIMQDKDIRQAAWEFARNNDKYITEEYLLLLLEHEEYESPQEVMLYFATKPSWIKNHSKIKQRVMKFLEKKSEFKLEFSAALALIEVEDEDIAVAFCQAIDNRVIWPVAFQIWNYLKSYKNLEVALVMLDILTNEEKSGTSFATSYLSNNYNDFPELKTQIYKIYPKLKLFKTTYEFLKIFEKNKDQKAVSIIVSKDYSILLDLRGIDKEILPKEVSQILSKIFGVEPPVKEKSAKKLWDKYLSNK